MPSSAPVVLEKAVVRNWKPPIAFGIFAIIALVMLIVFGRAGVTTFRLSTDRDLIQLPAISANVTIVSVAVTWRLPCVSELGEKPRKSLLSGLRPEPAGFRPA